VGELQGQVVGISRSSGGENYQGQVVGISRSSSGDIEVKWWGYQGQGEGLRGQGQKKVVGGACPLQLPLLAQSDQRCDTIVFAVDTLDDGEVYDGSTIRCDDIGVFVASWKQRVLLAALVIVSFSNED
jgi:hypothetical protein